MTEDSTARDDAAPATDDMCDEPTFAEKLAEVGNADDFNAWLALGVEKGWAGPSVCHTHDGLPTSLAEDEETWGEDEGGEPPCMHMIRLYESAEVRDAVEANHSPSIWRKPRAI